MTLYAIIKAEKHKEKEPKPRVRFRFLLAEGEGFEPPEAFTSTVFKTAAFDRSANLPYEIAVKAIFLKIQPLQICSISASSSAENVRLT